MPFTILTVSEQAQKYLYTIKFNPIVYNPWNLIDYEIFIPAIIKYAGENNINGFFQQTGKNPFFDFPLVHMQSG
jgi:hypothetical protein